MVRIIVGQVRLVEGTVVAAAHDGSRPRSVFVPVADSVRAIGRVTPVVVPAAELAIISHPGSLSDADLSYATLGSYATRHEISIDGPLREYYLRGVADTPDEAEWRTEIGWPIFRADASSGSASPPGTGG